VKTGIRSHYGNNRWMCFSVKLGRFVNLESDLEYDYWKLVDSDPEIVEYREHPLRVQVTVGSSSYVTTFDMWERRKDGSERYVEVKYRHEIDQDSPRRSERSLRQVALQKQWCADHGFSYAVVTDQEIYANPLLLKNKKRLLSLVREEVHDDWIRLIQMNVQPDGLLIEKLMRQVPEITPMNGMIAVSHLLYKGILEADLHQCAFGADSRVWRTGGYSKNPPSIVVR
jgi:hypothetical protein